MKKAMFPILVAVLLLAASIAQAVDHPSGYLIVPDHHRGVMGDNDIPVTATALQAGYEYIIKLEVGYHENPRTPPEPGATAPIGYTVFSDPFSGDPGEFDVTFTVPLPDCHWQISAHFTLLYWDGQHWIWNGDERATEGVDIWSDCPGEGCTPGFWQGKKNGRLLWDEMPDGDFDPAGGNPYATGTVFNDFFDPPGPGLDDLTMLDLVGKGGGSDPVRKAARDLVAAYLSASYDGVDYPYSQATLEAMWVDAMTPGGDWTLPDLQAALNNANELGCPID